jgi:hypothetical protein
VRVGLTVCLKMRCRSRIAVADLERCSAVPGTAKRVQGLILARFAAAACVSEPSAAIEDEIVQQAVRRVMEPPQAKAQRRDAPRDDADATFGEDCGLTSASVATRFSACPATPRS